MTLTDLDGVVVGALVASTTVDTKGFPAVFGMVVDCGCHDDGRPYAELLVEVPPREARCEVYFRSAAKPKTYNVAKLTRLDFADIKPDGIEEPSAIRMEGWARKAALGWALNGGSHELLYAAGSLYLAAKTLYADRAAS